MKSLWTRAILAAAAAGCAGRATVETNPDEAAVEATLSEEGREVGAEQGFLAQREALPGQEAGLARQAAVQAAMSLPVYPTSWTRPFAHGIHHRAGWCAGYCSERVVGIAVDPTDPNVVYIAEENGGIAKTTDGGQSWSFLTDSQPSLSMNAVVIDPISPSIVYAGTGRFGGGVLRSLDSGASWSVVGNLAGAAVEQLVVDPFTAGSETATTLYARVSHGSASGLYQSLDSGQTWNLLHAGGTSDLVVDPNTGAIYLAASQGLLLSTDGGATWTQVHANPGGKPSKVALSGGSLYFVDMENGTSLFLSADQGASWTLQSQQAAVPYGLVYLAVSPVDPNEVFIGAGFEAFLESSDGGKTFSFNPTCSKVGVVHPDAHAIAFAPSDPTQIYVGNDGGIYKSTNSGACWSDLNENLSTWMAYSVGVSDDGSYAATVQDDGDVADFGKGELQEIEGGDGSTARIDPVNDTLYYGGYVREPIGTGVFLRRDPSGKTADITPKEAVAIESANWLPPLYMNPLNGAELITGFQNLYWSVDRGASWTRVGTLSSDPNLRVAAICRSAASADVVYVALSRGVWDRSFLGPGALWVTANATAGNAASWAELDTGLPHNAQEPTACAVDPQDPLTAYVTYTMYGNGSTPHLFKTTDQGQTWAAIGNGLPDAPFFDVVADPAVPGRVYVATDVGAFTSPNGGGAWAAMSRGMPRNPPASAFGFNVDTRQLVVGTYGRGAFTLTVPCPAGRTLCGGACVDASSDPGNCGACGVTCDLISSCTAGACVSICPAPELDCGGTCTDPDVDPFNCGGCGRVCPNGQFCNVGACTDCGESPGAFCAPGGTCCGPGSCANTGNDPNNCGGCGIVCPAGTKCLASVCG